MKTPRSSASKKSKNTQLFFALFTVLFLNIIWMRNSMFSSKKQSGQMVLSSYHELDCDSNFSSTSTNSTSVSLGSIDTQTRRSIRTPRRSLRASYSVENINYKTGNCTGASEIDTLDGSRVNPTTGDRVNAITVTVERDDLECDVCDDFNSTTIEKTVYIVGGTIDSATIQQITNAIIEEDRERIEGELRERSEEEKIKRCEINPSTGEPFRRRDPGEALEYYTCKMKYAAESHRNDERRKKSAITQIMTKMLRLASAAKMRGDLETALLYLEEMISSPYFYLLSESKQASIEGLKEIMTLYSENTTPYLDPLTGEMKDYSLHSLIQDMNQAKQQGNQDAYNQLHGLFKIMKSNLLLKFDEVIRENDDFDPSTLRVLSHEINAIKEDTYLTSLTSTEDTENLTTTPNSESESTAITDIIRNTINLMKKHENTPPIEL